MKRKVIIDTSPIVAILSPQDNYHQICVETLKTIEPPMLTSWAVITEVLWLIRHNQIAIESLFKMLEVRLLEIVELPYSSLPWLKIFMSKYYDIGVQIADASLCYLAENYQTNKIFTLDKKDFYIYRIKGNQSLDIIP